MIKMVTNGRMFVYQHVQKVSNFALKYAIIEKKYDEDSKEYVHTHKKKMLNNFHSYLLLIVS